MQPPSQTLCGYPLLEPLRDHCTFLASAPANRRVVLKRLDADCLLRGGLHPSVRERLERVREIAHAGVANLHGVARDRDQAWLIWEYVPGEPIDAYAADPHRPPAEIRGLARELALTVDSLHQQGIVHGALIPSNIIVSPTGIIHLTHVSPLLFAEPAVDFASILALLEHVLDIRGERQTPLGGLLAEARASGLTLSMLASRLAAEPPAAPEAPQSEPPPSPPRVARRRALAAALIVTIAALAGGALLYRKLEPRPKVISPISPGTEITIRH